MHQNLATGVGFAVYLCVMLAIGWVAYCRTHGVGAAFGPHLLAAPYWDKATGWGALAGIVVGGATVLIWRHLTGGLFDLYELVPGSALSSVAVVIVSLLGPAAPVGVAARHKGLNLSVSSVE